MSDRPLEATPAPAQDPPPAAIAYLQATILRAAEESSEVQRVRALAEEAGFDVRIRLNVEIAWKAPSTPRPIERRPTRRPTKRLTRADRAWAQELGIRL